MKKATDKKGRTGKDRRCNVPAGRRVRPRTRRGRRRRRAAPEAGAIPAQRARRIPRTRLDERLLRVMADFENFRKRTLREQAEAHRQAQEEFIRSLLSVLDHLDLALAAAEARRRVRWWTGFGLVSDELLSALRSGRQAGGSGGTALRPSQA